MQFMIGRNPINIGGIFVSNLAPCVFVPVTVYVSNNCVQAKITQGNITALNGVIHMIDHILGFVYLDAFTQIQRDTLWL
jgi:Fasciclin domain